MLEMNCSWLFAPAAMLYGVAAVLRNTLFDCGILCSRSFPLPVICVGNLAVGGTGKTPHVEYILQLLHTHGYKVAMLSRGYGRKTRGFRVCSGDDTAHEVGDEPLQISRNCSFATVAVCEDRCAGIERLLTDSEGPNVIVLDDAMQHRYVKPGLTILLTDSHSPYTSDHMLPWGRLREPRSGAKRADVVVVTKCEAETLPQIPVLQRQALCHTGLVYGEPYLFPVQQNVSENNEEKLQIEGAVVLVITGIASPEALYTHVRASKPRKMVGLRFPDHHEFTSVDVEKINNAYSCLLNAFPSNTQRLALTTEKDAVRLSMCDGLSEDLRTSLWVQPIRIEQLDNNQNKPTLNQIILNYVRENQRNSLLD